MLKSLDRAGSIRELANCNLDLVAAQEVRWVGVVVNQ